MPFPAPDSVHQLVDLSMASKSHPSALRTDHQFLDDCLRYPAAVEPWWSVAYATAAILLSHRQLPQLADFVENSWSTPRSCLWQALDTVRTDGKVEAGD